MNKTATQRTSRPLLSDLAPLLDGLPTFTALRPLFDGRAIRVEDERYEGMYEIRAELPGVDPEEDIEVTVRDGRLTITAERVRAGESTGRSEFNYGSLSRTLLLPDGADQDDVNATYTRGILTVLVPVSDEDSAEKHIEVVEIDDIDDTHDTHDDVLDEADDSEGSDDAAGSDASADQLVSAEQG